MIVSLTERRMRIRSGALRIQKNLGVVRASLQALPGVIATLANVRTGSLLVHFNPEILTAQALTEQVARLEEGLSPQRPAKKRRPRAETLGLGAAYALTLLGLPWGRGIHAAAGIAFSALLARHALRRL
jgi:hypothetical protein